MTEVVPAVLAENYDDLRNKIAKFSNLAKTVQIDICDGRFVPSTSWPMNTNDKASVLPILDEEAGLPYWDYVDFEFDLMVMNAYLQFEFFSRLGAKKMIFHLEAMSDKNLFKEFLEGLDMYTRENIEIGIAINTNTNIDTISEFISFIDFVQCMGIEHIGFQGESFDERVLNQVKSLREKYKELIISVDGSVNEQTAPILVKAGVNKLVIGSALMRSYDVRESISEFENL